MCRDLGIIVTTAEVAAIDLFDRHGATATANQLIGETMALAAPDVLLEPDDIRIVLVHMGWFKKLKDAYAATPAALKARAALAPDGKGGE